ncbi:GNAT family N-acetyltransferase [Nocardioides sp. JQ2195]|uniref:GNAT family N-acetyltransferase n=1 Tax=Nocardioides sp. JQ2195 TaxID=2592334 RepID=UPI00143EC990|nr:GNAT family N-acetyltransferase [Nocardioides sp. JQ2195]QIX26072.1 GNAT family N-acetyltransferase [Nocardioides sp. JQ2195]
MDRAAATVEFFTDPRPFLAVAGERLAADPVVSTVVATVAGRRARSLDAGGEPADPGHPLWWAVVRDAAGTVTGSAMRTAPFPPYPLFVLPMPEAGARALARALHARGESVGGANGALPAVQHVAEETAGLAGHCVDVVERTRLFELGELVPPARPPAGRLRLMRTEECELALAWFRAFHVEADEQAGREPDPTQGEHVGLDDVLERIDDGRIFAWVDGDDRPLHLTGMNQPEYGVNRIGPVFTPRAHRGQGYASAAVAEVSRLITADGTRACLFTDQANPVSNAIYQRLGYRPVVDMANIVVGPRPSA